MFIGYNADVQVGVYCGKMVTAVNTHFLFRNAGKQRKREYTTK